MPDIRYVCLSDMHLGADNSLLTAIKPGSIETDTSRPSAVMSQMVLCLRELIARNAGAEKPTLILNGDILEMALTDVNKAAMVFERFIELVFPQDGEALFNKNILYFPGNHDHHIWESARETQYLKYICGMQPGAEIDAPNHTTNMFHPDLVREPFLTSLLQVYPHLRDATVNIAYPNYALLSNDGQKSVIFSHGHYVESIYSLMTSLNTMFFPERKRPTVIWELEAENFAWIDFFWSTVGRSGDVGQDIGLFYAKLQDNKQVEKLLANFITNWLAHTNQSKLLEGFEARGLEWVANFVFSKLHPLEKQRTDHALSADATRGLQWFMQGVLLEQIIRENNFSLPPDITFLFGHTHKPFQQEMNFSGYPAALKVYNSGGWVVDTITISQLHGAAVLLIDEELDVVSLCMYNQALNAEDYAVHVEEVTRPGMAKSAFYERINAYMNNGRDPWKTFSATVANAVRVRAQLLQTKINL
jgi:Calcineurin-like phosphoesterase